VINGDVSAGKGERRFTDSVRPEARAVGVRLACMLRDWVLPLARAAVEGY